MRERPEVVVTESTIFPTRHPTVGGNTSSQTQLPQQQTQQPQQNGVTTTRSSNSGDDSGLDIEEADSVVEKENYHFTRRSFV
jgi:hypothetical protein